MKHIEKRIIRILRDNWPKSLYTDQIVQRLNLSHKEFYYHIHNIQQKTDLIKEINENGYKLFTVDIDKGFENGF